MFGALQQALLLSSVDGFGGLSKLLLAPKAYLYKAQRVVIQGDDIYLAPAATIVTLNDIQTVLNQVRGGQPFIMLALCMTTFFIVRHDA